VSGLADKLKIGVMIETHASVMIIEELERDK
jgi:phosphoenolpyruvate-protein kinase (PTS system EI component)